MTSRAHSKTGRNLASIFLLTLACVVLAAPSASADPPQLWQKCDSDEPAGQRCVIPRGITADPNNGHVFLVDQGNARIVEFTALGEFVKTWGWDVVESGPGDDTAAPEDQFEICVPEDGDTCQPGDKGGGSGQLAVPMGVAVDSAGYVYVVDFTNARVQRFSAGGQFSLMFGGDVNKTKVDAAAPAAERNVCTAASGDVCQAGVKGTGSGQFGAWDAGSFIAVDTNATASEADDSVYVGDEERIQRFGTDGGYQAAIALPGETVQSLAVDASGNLYATYESKPNVHKLSPAGEPLSPTFELPVGGEGGSGLPIPTAVAVDAAGHVFVFGPTIVPASGGQPRHPIDEFDPSGALISSFGSGQFDQSTALATNLCAGSAAPGNLYVSNIAGAFFNAGVFFRAYGTAPTGCFNAFTKDATELEETGATLNGTVRPRGSAVTECRFEYGTTTSYGSVAPCAQSSAQIGEGDQPVPVHAEVSGLQPGTVYHFRLRATVGAAAEKGGNQTFKTFGPPMIGADHTAGATETEVTVKARVNPEGLATTYRVEYGLDATYGKSTAEVPLGAQRQERPVSATIEGLLPGTTYHWRIVATNVSGQSVGADHTATTYRAYSPATNCVNQAHRSGPAAFLPDCRAYEMVSPVDKNGGDIVKSLAQGTGDPGGNVQASPDGDKITYTTLTSFGDQPSSFRFNPYLASREEDGWSTHGIHQPVTGVAADAIVFGLYREFIAFTPDLCSSWLVDYQTPPPTSDAQEGYRNLYRRDNCTADGELEALTSALPPGTSDVYINNRSVQGVTNDGSHAVFIAETMLSPDAAAPGPYQQVYDRFQGENHLVSVLPNGEADGSGAEVGSGWNANLDNAVSADGSGVYWTSSINSGVGTIYLRQHPEQGIVEGECSEPAKACTLPVSGAFPAFFWAAAADGSQALYEELNPATEDANLFVFDLQEAEGGLPPRLVAANVEGVAGASDDLSHIYFVSREALPDSGENSEGAEADDGEPNLYLDREGALSFVATLAEGDIRLAEPDVTEPAYNVVSRSTYIRSTRVSAENGRIVFQSRAPLTGFDNTDPESGEAAVEVFTYQPGGELVCASCNPSGARPTGVRELRMPYSNAWNPRGPTRVVAAAWIATWERPLYPSNAVSEDGGRLFFNSNDALLPRDTNEAQDVYQWEAPGNGSCSEGSGSYFAQNGGCLDLISSGESPFESEFWEASPDGDDVFFTTASSLLSQDPGLVDLYDARVGGGFPQPAEASACEGESCQPAPTAPNDPTPASSAFEGPGDLRHRTTKPRCPKGKRRARATGKARCVRKKGKRQTNRNRRAPR